MTDVVIIEGAVITGIHKTKISAHPLIALPLVPDDSYTPDPDCVQVVFLGKDNKAQSIMGEVTFPKNPSRGRHTDGKRCNRQKSGKCAW